jgi:tRNA(Ile)-lysidine synthase
MSGDALSNSPGATEVTPPLLAADAFLKSFSKPVHVLIAVSGGSDSTGLLAALAERRHILPASRIALSAATIDHGMRPASADEARDVAALCARLGLPHHIRRWEGDKPKAGLMAAARDARYGLLGDIAAKIGADVVVTAHTLDDQMETLAMRSARRPQGDDGIAATGIADAMLFDRRLWIVRPFLASRRADIRGYLRERGLCWIEDPSNEDSRYERVRVRKQLAGGVTLASPLQDGAGARAAISWAAAAWLRENVTVHRHVLCAVGRGGMAADEAVLSYALSHLTAVFGGHSFGPGRERMERMLAFLRKGDPGRRTTGSVVFDLRRDGLYLTRESRNLPSLDLATGTAAVWDGRFLIANDGRAPIRIVAGAGGDAAMFDGRLPKAAVMRARAASPHIEGQATTAAIAPYLAPFDRFLTRFDLTFANCLADAFTRQPYGIPPF